MNTIEFDNFSCYYKNKKEYTAALDHISLNIFSGELFVVLGESGSGKTTLLKCILDLCDYIEGNLLVDGVSVDDLKLSKSNIGFVLYDGKTQNRFSSCYSGTEICYVFCSPDSVNFDTLNEQGKPGNDAALQTLQYLLEMTQCNSGAKPHRRITPPICSLQPVGLCFSMW